MISNYIEVLYNNEYIETERLILRKFEKKDAVDVYEYGSDPETIKYISWLGVNSIDKALKNIIEYYWTRPGIFAIELKLNKKCIGCAELRIIPEHDKASYVYLINRQYWGKGYATETMQALYKMCFEKIKLNRVETIHYTGNENSGNVMKKCGMELEGIKKDELIIKDILRDVVHYGITKKRWILVNKK